MEVLGLLDITGESLWIGVLCSLVALPLNLLWIFLFRYSRVSHIYYLTSYKFIWFKNQRYFFFRFATLIEISLKLKSKASCYVMIPKRCLWANRVTQFLSCENPTRSCKELPKKSMYYPPSRQWKKFTGWWLNQTPLINSQWNIETW